MASPTIPLGMIKKLATLLLGLTLSTIFLTPRGCNGDSYGRSVLFSPWKLVEGQSIEWGDVYKFRLEPECNLVLYEGERAVWLSNPARGKNLGCFARVQTDGNFVLYTKKWEIVWSSKSWQGGNARYALILQPNRDVVLYGRDIWSTKTSEFPPHEDHNSTSATILAATTTGDLI